MSETNYQAMHQQLLDMLGAKDHVDAGRVIAGLHAPLAQDIGDDLQLGWKSLQLYTTPQPAPVDAAVEKDARRYRYIIKFSTVQTAVETLLGKDTLFGPEFDDAIDAALAAQQQESK